MLADVTCSFDAQRRWDLAKAEGARCAAEQQAERDRARQEAVELQARKVRQETSLVRVVEQAAKARELRQDLARAPQPREGEGG